MIFDGYSRHFTAHDGSNVLRIVYRPALDAERRWVRLEAKFLQDAGKEVICDFICSHVVAPRISATDVRAWSDNVLLQIFQAVQGLVADSTGEIWKEVEPLYLSNLKEGLRLKLTHPLIANRSCELCQKLWFSERTGRPIRDGNGKPMPRCGETLCQTPAGCPKGTPDKQKSFNRSNWWAYEHFLQCEQTGNFPDDPIVIRNKIAIEQVREQVRRERDREKAEAARLQAAGDRASAPQKTSRMASVVR